MHFPSLSSGCEIAQFFVRHTGFGKVEPTFQSAFSKQRYAPQTTILEVPLGNQPFRMCFRNNFQRFVAQIEYSRPWTVLPRETHSERLVPQGDFQNRRLGGVNVRRFVVRCRQTHTVFNMTRNLPSFKRLVRTQSFKRLVRMAPLVPLPLQGLMWWSSTDTIIMISSCVVYAPQTTILERRPNISSESAFSKDCSTFVAQIEYSRP